MCDHNYATIHPTDNCIICFHEIFKDMTYQEIINLYKECKDQRKKDKPFDYDKVYKSMVIFYIEKKKYSKEQANEIAEKVVKKQQAEWNNK